MNLLLFVCDSSRYKVESVTSFERPHLGWSSQKDSTVVFEEYALV